MYFCTIYRMMTRKKVGMATPKKTKASTEKSKSVQENELSAVLVNGISTDAR
jgi:hypothetical protein